MSRRGIKIREVQAGASAQVAGLAPGDEILAVNGHAVEDELALKFYLAEGHIELEVLKPGGERLRIPIELAEGASLGVEVEDFRTRTCNNACLFCFVNQLPPDARQSLRVKDDDYRLSFLHGNYITLTNLSDRELDRIIEQALSPLYVSVHATDPVLRAKIMGRNKPDDLTGKMRKLIDGGIRIQAQVVVLPQWNDGDHLRKTVYDLYSLHPGVHSVAVVPLGLSDHGPAHKDLIPVTPRLCRIIIRQAEPWQRQFRREGGSGFVYLADEFFIQGQMPIPKADYYDDFAQIEDGIGMVRRFLNEFDCLLARPRKARPALRGTLATGRLFFPFLQECVKQFNLRLHSHLTVVAVENRYLGKGITVAGLLAGRDFAARLAGQSLGDFIIIPQDAISRVDGTFIDDQTPEDLGRSLGTPVFTSGHTLHDFFRLICRME